MDDEERLIIRSVDARPSDNGAIELQLTGMHGGSFKVTLLPSLLDDLIFQLREIWQSRPDTPYEQGPSLQDVLDMSPPQQKGFWIYSDNDKVVVSIRNQHGNSVQYPIERREVRRMIQSLENAEKLFPDDQ